MTDRVVHRPEEGRYELVVDGTVAGFADYRPAPGSDDVLVFPHTVIDPDRRGRGLGAELVGAALDDVRSRDCRVVPTCWYVAEFIDRNPAYRDLLA